jgi:NADP-dependent alcohol dehydrogenase
MEARLQWRIVPLHSVGSSAARQSTHELRLKCRRNEPMDKKIDFGGGSVIDDTKFMPAAALLPEARRFPDKKIDFGCVLTLPATGSEWNSNFVQNRRSCSARQGSGCAPTFPVCFIT